MHSEKKVNPHGAFFTDSHTLEKKNPLERIDLTKRYPLENIEDLNKSPIKMKTNFNYDYKSKKNTFYKKIIQEFL